jgi:hypothetical protein
LRSSGRRPPGSPRPEWLPRPYSVLRWTYRCRGTTDQCSNRLRRHEAATTDDHAWKAAGSQHRIKAVTRDPAKTRSGLLDRIQRSVHNVTSGSIVQMTMSGRLDLGKAMIRTNSPTIGHPQLASRKIRFSRELRGRPRMQPNARAVFVRSGPSMYGNTSREGDSSRGQHRPYARPTCLPGSRRSRRCSAASSHPPLGTPHSKSARSSQTSAPI